jgi:hypothetical protein
MIPRLRIGGSGPFAAGAYEAQAGGQDGEALVSMLHGEVFTAAQRGRVFISSTVATGIAIPIYTTTAPTMVLWNPGDSGRYAVMLRYLLSHASGNTAEGAVGLAFVKDTGNDVGTGAPISVFNQSTPVNAIVGAGITSGMKSSVAATNTLTTAGTWFMAIFSNYDKPTAGPTTQTVYDFGGGLLVPPGVAVYAVSSVASVGLFAQTFIWEEVSRIVYDTR